MTKQVLLGIGVLGGGAVLGFTTGGLAGMLVAAVCLVVGLVLLVSSEAARTYRVGKQATRPAHQKTQVVFLIKEIHARPQKGGKFQEILDPQQEGLEFELFVHCWLVNETELPVQLAQDLQLTLALPGKVPFTPERIREHLNHWRLGKLNKEADQWDALVIRAAQEAMEELNTAEPLQCGVAREGWLHFRVSGLTPADMKAVAIEIRVTDSLFNVHQATASCPKQTPGRVWPFQAAKHPTPEIGLPLTEVPLPPTA